MAWLSKNGPRRFVPITASHSSTGISVTNALGMGAAATFVLLGSNTIVSLLRKLIPDAIRLPCYIVVIATFVTICEMLLKAFLPALNASLGIFVPLIVVNCVILARAESFASKHRLLPAIADALGMGLGFTIVSTIVGDHNGVISVRDNQPRGAKFVIELPV